MQCKSAGSVYNSQLTRVYRMQCRKTYLKPFSQTFSWQTSVKTSLQSFVCLVMVIHFSLLLAQIHCRCKIQNKMSHKGSSLTLLLIHEHSLNGIMTATAVSQQRVFVPVQSKLGPRVLLRVGSVQYVNGAEGCGRVAHIQIIHF